MNTKLIDRWREESGVIYFSVTSDGTTGKQWVARLKKKGYRVSDYAKSLLRSDDFQSTRDVTTEVAVLKGSLFQDNDRITKKIRTTAEKFKLGKPQAEIACLIRDKFSDQEIEAMGLRGIVVMHEPIENGDGRPGLLSADRDTDSSWLRAYYGHPDGRWRRADGFAFVVSK